MKKIALTEGKFALVDDEDYARLSKVRWRVKKDGRTYYAMARSSKNGKQTHFSMHRQIVSVPESMMTDHIDGDGLNNQKHNLRTCTNAENQHNSKTRKDNTSGYKGVHWSKSSKKWLSKIKLNGVDIYIGTFNCLIKGAKAYDKKATELFGDFAKLNFPGN